MPGRAARWANSGLVEIGRRRRTRQIGLAVEIAVVGTAATAVGAGTIIVVGKGLHLAGRALVPRATLRSTLALPANMPGAGWGRSRLGT